MNTEKPKVPEKNGQVVAIFILAIVIIFLFTANIKLKKNYSILSKAYKELVAENKNKKQTVLPIIKKSNIINQKNDCEIIKSNYEDAINKLNNIQTLMEVDAKKGYVNITLAGHNRTEYLNSIQSILEKTENKEMLACLQYVILQDEQHFNNAQTLYLKSTLPDGRTMRVPLSKNTNPAFSVAYLKTIWLNSKVDGSSMDASIWHELAHLYHGQKISSTFNDQWMDIATSGYIPERIYGNNKNVLAWKDNFSSDPKAGFANAYSSSNLSEDVACFYEAGMQALYKDLASPLFYAPMDHRYHKKLNLLYQYGFFNKEQYAKIKRNLAWY